MSWYVPMIMDVPFDVPLELWAGCDEWFSSPRVDFSFGFVNGVSLTCTIDASLDVAGAVELGFARVVSEMETLRVVGPSSPSA